MRLFSSVILLASVLVVNFAMAQSAPAKKKNLKQTQTQAPTTKAAEPLPNFNEPEVEIPARPRARQTQSELMHQADAGRMDLTPSMFFLGTVLKYKSGYQLSEADGSTLDAGIGFEYGLNDVLALGLKWGYASGSYTYKTNDSVTVTNVYNSTTSSGLNDPSIDLKGRIDTGMGFFRFGADLSIATEKSKIDASGDSNVATGRTVLTPFVGYEVKLPQGFLGGKILYDVYRSDAKEDDQYALSSQKGDHTISGGQELQVEAFYEGIISPLVTLGGYLNFASSASSTDHYQGSSSDSGSGSAMTLGVYAPFHLPHEITLLPILAYGRVTSGLSSAIDSEYLLATGVQARFTF